MSDLESNCRVGELRETNSWPNQVNDDASLFGPGLCVTLPSPAIIKSARLLWCAATPLKMLLWRMLVLIVGYGYSHVGDEPLCGLLV